MGSGEEGGGRVWRGRRDGRVRGGRMGSGKNREDRDEGGRWKREGMLGKRKEEKGRRVGEEESC